jgi:hypothetical protein
MVAGLPSTDSKSHHPSMAERSSSADSFGIFGKVLRYLGLFAFTGWLASVAPADQPPRVVTHTQVLPESEALTRAIVNVEKAIHWSQNNDPVKAADEDFNSLWLTARQNAIFINLLLPDVENSYHSDDAELSKAYAFEMEEDFDRQLKVERNRGETDKKSDQEKERDWNDFLNALGEP